MIILVPGSEAYMREKDHGLDRGNVFYATPHKTAKYHKETYQTAKAPSQKNFQDSYKSVAIDFEFQL